MKEQQISIHQFQSMFLDEMQRIGYPLHTIYGTHYGAISRIVRYYEKSGTDYYSVKTTNEFVDFHKERYERGELSRSSYAEIRSAALKMNEFFITGHISPNGSLHGTIYKITAEQERLIDDFIAWKGYGPNTRDDVRWTVRKYLHYLTEKGHDDLSDVQIEEVRTFIPETAMDVRASSLHNIMLYLKHFHIYLKEAGIPAPDCVELFAYRVYRDMPIQSYVTDEELDRIIAVIDRTSASGKRDYAIIRLGETTGMRACDIIRLKLKDIDWRKNEIHIIQKKTQKPVILPLIKEAGNALQDYILHGRPDTEFEEVFLRNLPPYRPILEATTIGEMFMWYQKKAGITRQPFDGKGFHGLRRRLAKKLIMSGTPPTSIAQILGHTSRLAVRQYLSLDTSNLKECALGLDGIGTTRKELM